MFFNRYEEILYKKFFFDLSHIITSDIKNKNKIIEIKKIKKELHNELNENIKIHKKLCNALKSKL